VTNQWRTHFAALLLVLLAHAAFVAWLFTVRPHAFHSLHREVADIAAVLLIQLPPPPPPPSADATPAERTNVSKPAPKLALSKTDAESKLEADDGPPKHGMGSGVDWANTISTPATIATGPRRVPSDYADKVKAKVVANLVRPEGAVFKPQGGDKADAKYLLRQCTIPYEVTVDREGKVLSIKIESCGDKLLDAAAEAALHKSAPFPPPPNAGASSYVIYGSANFRAQ
jgi:periplasmic protein TonB